jgi:hypothetical protein
VHDIADLESRGLPGVFAASREFVVAAAAQSDALGFPAAVVFVDHPIQDRTDEEMRALAAAALPALIDAITRSSTPPAPDR